MRLRLAHLAPAVFSLVVATAACGGGDGTDSKLPDDQIPCRSGDCGKESFRRAVPSRATVKIGFQGASARTSTPALEAVAPGYLDLGDHVDEINQTVDDIFGELELLAGETPETQDDTLHRWRVADPELPGSEIVLTVTTTNDHDFELAYAVGEAGFEPAETDEVLTGEVHLDDDGGKETFALTLDFDTATAIDPSLGLTGDLEVSARPTADGGREIWYDFFAFGELGQPTEDSLTTYWVLGEDDGALEYLDALHDSDATLFARWDAGGGRLDYHVEWTHPSEGILDEISTNCWAGAGAETFYGWAVIDDATGDFYVELDGGEADCAFGPLEGHPSPGTDFDDLPAEGEWDDLEASSAPFCEDEPDDPECLSYCDLLPDAC